MSEEAFANARARHARRHDADLDALKALTGVLSARAPAGELASLAGWQDTWSRLHARRRASDAIDQAPEGAGPLNSHKLVIHTLETLRTLSPGALEQFMAWADTLLWLDHHAGHLAVPDPEPVRGERRPVSASRKSPRGPSPRTRR